MHCIQKKTLQYVFLPSFYRATSFIANLRENRRRIAEHYLFIN